MLSVKIKLSVILLFVCVGVWAQGQTQADSLKHAGGDSTQIKLNAYKKLFDSGVIGEDEYNNMKSQLLNTQQPAITGTTQSKVADSTQVKLDQLKKLYDTGVIGEDEFIRSKDKILGIALPETKTVVKPDIVITKADTMNLKALHDRAKSKVVAGSVILGVGVGFLTGEVLYAVLAPKPNSTDADTLSSEKVTRKGAEVALGVLGGVASIGGAVFLALGLKDRTIYRRRNKSLTMNFTGKEIEFAFVF